MPDSTPNYLTVDPNTGAVGADFTGHIHAQGLDLDAPPNAVAGANNAIRWLRTDNGALIATMDAYRVAGTNRAKVIVNGTTDTSGSNDIAADIEANSDSSTRQAQLEVGILKDIAQVKASTVNPTLGQSFTANILDDTGKSSFIRTDSSIGDGVRANIQTVSSVMPVGVAGFALTTPASATSVVAVIPASHNPVTHWGFVSFGNHVGLGCQLVIQNNGAAQNFSVDVIILYIR